MIWVILVEDDNEIRESLFELLNESESIKCVGQFEDCESMLTKLSDLLPDVVLKAATWVELYLLSAILPRHS